MPSTPAGGSLAVKPGFDPSLSFVEPCTAAPTLLSPAFAYGVGGSSAVTLAEPGSVAVPAALVPAAPSFSSLAGPATVAVAKAAATAAAAAPVPAAVQAPAVPFAAPPMAAVTSAPPLDLQEDLGEAGRQLAAVVDLAEVKRSLRACGEVREALRGQGDGGAKDLIMVRKEMLRKAAEQLKAQHSIKVEQQMRAQEMLLDQEASVQRMRLQQVFYLRKAQLEQQAAALTSEYSQRKVQETFQKQQEDLQQEFLKQQEKELKRMSEQATKLRANAQEVASLAAKAEAAATVAATIASSPSMVETLAPSLAGRLPWCGSFPASGSLQVPRGAAPRPGALAANHGRVQFSEAAPGGARRGRPGLGLRPAAAAREGELSGSSSSSSRCSSAEG